MGLIDFSLSDVGTLFTGIREALTGEKVKDPIKVAEINLQLSALEQKLTEIEVQGQIDINKIEAASDSLFVAGWRPAVGWVAVLALFFMYVPKAIVMTSVWTYQCFILINTNDIFVQLPIFPELGAMDIIGLVASMLGIAGLRTYDKYKGIATSIITKKEK